MPDHLPGRRGEALGSHEVFLARQDRGGRQTAGERDGGHDHETAAPADEIGERAGDKAPAETAEARCRHVGAGGADGLRGRPFLADIGDHDGEDRRQREAEQETPEDQQRQARRERDHHQRQRGDDHRRHDHALAPEHIRDGAGKRRGQRDRKRRRRHGQADLRRARRELLRQRRQQRLRPIEIEERAETRNADRGAAKTLIHAVVRLSGWNAALSLSLPPKASSRERSPGMRKRCVRRARRVDACPNPCRRGHRSPAAARLSHRHRRRRRAGFRRAQFVSRDPR